MRQAAGLRAHQPARRRLRVAVAQRARQSPRSACPSRRPAARRAQGPSRAAAGRAGGPAAGRTPPRGPTRPTGARRRCRRPRRRPRAGRRSSPPSNDAGSPWSMATSRLTTSVIALSDVSRKWCTMPSSVADRTTPISRPLVRLRRPSRGAVDRDPDLRQPLRERVRRRERRVRVPRRVLAGPDLRGVHRERRHGRDEPRRDVGRVPRGAQRRAGEQGVVEAEAHRRHALELQLLGRLRGQVGQPGVALDGRRVARTRREHHVAAADQHDAGARAAHDARRQGHVRAEGAQGGDGRDQLRRRRRRAAVLRQVRAEHVPRQLVRDHHADAGAHARVRRPARRPAPARSPPRGPAPAGRGSPARATVSAGSTAPGAVGNGSGSGGGSVERDHARDDVVRVRRHVRPAREHQDERAGADDSPRCGHRHPAPLVPRWDAPSRGASDYCPRQGRP